MSTGTTYSTTNKQNHNTLDTRHTKTCAEFQKTYVAMASNVSALSNLDVRIRQYQAIGLSNLSESEFTHYIALVDERKVVRADVQKVSNRSTEMQYMLDTADIMFKYYDILEKGNGSEPETIVTSNSILKYFMPEDTSSHNNAASSGSSNGVSSGSSGGAMDPAAPHNINSRSTISEAEDRATLLERYLERTDKNYFKEVHTDALHKCPICDRADRVILPSDGLCYCPHCHSIETIIIDHEKPSYKDPPKEITYFAYKRINHLNEWISQIQGKESTDIPCEIYDKILLEIRKQRITNMTATKITEILKRLGCNKYYEHIPHIMSRLNGAPSISLTPEIEEKLRQMFKMIQIPFFKYAPKSRKNFLSYSYTIHKCLQLLELDSYLKYFPLLKSREKTFQMDEVWQKICNELNWQFIASV
jgi:hypothetical protein